MPERDPLRVMDAKLHSALYHQKCVRSGSMYNELCYESKYGIENVPHYSIDIAAAWKAEGDLPEGVRDGYLFALRGTVVDVYTGFGDDDWQVRRATPEQMVRAMLSAMGVGA